MRVYYNLHKKCLSVMDKKTRLVVAHVDSIHLENVKFIVSTAGLVRLRREKRKNVCAFVEGDYILGHGERVIGNPVWMRAYFNPYKVDHFIILGKGPIYEADRVFITDKNMYVKEMQCVSF